MANPKEVIIPITKRAREYGYVIWKKSDEPQMRQLLGKREEIAIILFGGKHGTKRVDWGRSRISIGYRWTRLIEATQVDFVLQMNRSGELEITCK